MSVTLHPVTTTEPALIVKGHTHAIAQTVGQTKTAMKVVTINKFKCYTNNWPWFEHHKKIH